MNSSPVEQIKDRLDIVDLISGYIKLDKAGRNYKAKCPFHSEKTPSFIVSPDRQTFYCFGCQAKGDMFEFVEKFEGVEFKEALKTLAAKAGVELKNYDREEGKVELDRKEKIYDAVDAATDMYEKLLQKSVDSLEVLEYLRKRGLPSRAIKKWRIGWAPAEWRTILEGLRERGFKEQELLDAGLVKKTEDGNKVYDVFRGRIMFPIFDMSGRVIAFSGRILKDDGKSPKYVNTPETTVFKKSDALYGIHEAKTEIRRLDYSVLVEGQLDLVLSHEAGVRNTLASSGTALTESHLKRIAKLSNRIILAYDADEAGAAAVRRSGELALSLGMEVKVAQLPQGEDPGSIIPKSKEHWKEILKKSVNLIEFTVDEAVRLSKTNGANKISELPRRFNKEVIPLLASLQSEMARSEFVALAAKKTKISEKSIWADIERYNSQWSASSELSGAESPSLIEPLQLSAVEMLCGLLLLYKQGGENLPAESSKLALIEETFYKLVGKEAALEAMENSRLDKETLIFETESRLDGLRIEEAAAELLQRVEKDLLEHRLLEVAKALDQAKEFSEKEQLGKQVVEISKRISEL